jgi:lipoprotein-anchoring transpeptidase ErfK/SrfK
MCTAVPRSIGAPAAAADRQPDLLVTEKLTTVQQLCDRYSVTMSQSQVLVSVDAQRLYLFESRSLSRSYSISTALNGIGQEEGTGKIPLGLHAVDSKIGEGADPFAIFKSRVPTGALALPNEGEASIVGRILWLKGLEPGFNQGRNAKGTVVDSHDRYIYIHGTNDIVDIGRPVSAGCVRMVPEDVVDLFPRVAEGTIVYIYVASKA